MKRLIIALSIIAMLGVIFPGLPTLAQPIRTPHENPDTATGLLDEAGLLLSYSQIINLAIESQYRSAQDILDELERVDIPEEIQYIIDQYTSLFQRLFTTLDNLEALLDEASDLLVHNQIAGVEDILERAHVDIEDAYILLGDTETATSIMSDKLGVFAASATSQLTQAYTRLEKSMEKLTYLIDKLNILKQSLTEQYEQKTGLMPVELSLSINPTSAYVGDVITASGNLSCDANPLPGRKVSFNLDYRPVATAVIRSDGSYITSIMLPYKYTGDMVLTAAYEPEGNDIDICLACESPPVIIDPMFYQTTLEVSTSKRVYRGLPFIVSGKVNSNNDNIDRNINVLLDGTSLTEEVASGQFSFEILATEKVLPGTAKLTVAVSPQGRYSGASRQQSVVVSVLPIYSDIQIPPIILPPRDIRVGGTAYNAIGPIADAKISLNFNDTLVTTRTDHEGNFAASLEVPLDLFLMGPQEILIKIEPVEPWSTKTSVKKQVPTVNLLSTILILGVLIALWVVIRRRVRVRAHIEDEMPPEDIVEVTAPTPLSVPEPRLTGIKGQVLSTYRSVITVIEKISGVIMSPDITLREFLKIASLPSPTATNRFAELTAIAESALYSAYRPRKDTAARAEELAANIKEELHSGTP